MQQCRTVKHGWILLCICTPLYNETLRGCFTVGEKKKYQKMMIHVASMDAEATAVIKKNNKNNNTKDAPG